MHEINPIPPERMTPEQRRREIAALLANGLVRLRNAAFDQSGIGPRESEFVLGFFGHPSVHTDSVNNENTESK
jgi:hypothetical protein